MDRIQALGSFDEHHAATCIATIANALLYLHDHGVAHRDIKPENLLFKDSSQNSSLVLVDFGVSALPRRPGSLGMSTLAGTPFFLAPELVAGKSDYTEKVDIWSLGVAAYQLLIGSTPFGDAESFTELYSRIQRADYGIPATARLSNLARDFIVTLLEPNPDQRPSARQVLQHPWILAHCPQEYLALLHEFNVEADPIMYGPPHWRKVAGELKEWGQPTLRDEWISAGAPGVFEVDRVWRAPESDPAPCPLPSIQPMPLIQLPRTAEPESERDVPERYARTPDTFSLGRAGWARDIPRTESAGSGTTLAADLETSTDSLPLTLGGFDDLQFQPDPATIWEMLRSKNRRFSIDPAESVQRAMSDPGGFGMEPQGTPFMSLPRGPRRKSEHESPMKMSGLEDMEGVKPSMERRGSKDAEGVRRMIALFALNGGHERKQDV